MKILAAHRYAGHARDIANRMKNATDDQALEEAAVDMAPLIPEGAAIVPAPSSSGLNPATIVLAQKLQALVLGTRVVEAVVRKTPVPSSTLLRRAGRPAVTVDEHLASMKLIHMISKNRKIVVVDNVLTEGNTIRAVEKILGRPVLAVVYAQASRQPLRNPLVPLRICIAGSRGFRALEMVDEIIKVLPVDVIVVHGGAEGVDQRAERATQARGLGTEIWRPQWDKHGRSAGPIRNREMMQTCDFLYAFWDGRSKGTASTIQAARELGKPHEVLLDP